MQSHFFNVFLFIIVGLCRWPRVTSLDNGLGRTPPMGWLSWERFRCNIDCKNQPDDCISEKLYKDMADRLVGDGYRELGYVYVNIDDCWSESSRDNATKQLVPDRQRFPNGIKALADYMHQRGLKLGIYADYGLFTCGGYPGSLGHLDIDAKTFASWQVDSVKFDGCFSDPKTDKVGYPAFGKALNATGRPMLYSCEWPLYETMNNISSNFTAIAETCNLFRNYGDVDDSFDSIKDIVQHYGRNQGGFLQVSAPGSFNDPDMIIVGDFGLSYDQQQLQLGMWAMFAAPLYMSNDLRKISPDSKALLQNKALIAINQDALGLSGILATTSGDIQIWTRKLSHGRFAIAAINFGIGGTPTRISKSMADLHVPAVVGTTYMAADVFAMKAIGAFQPNSPIPFRVNPTGINLFVFSPK